MGKIIAEIEIEDVVEAVTENHHTEVIIPVKSPLVHTSLILLMRQDSHLNVELVEACIIGKKTVLLLRANLEERVSILVRTQMTDMKMPYD